MSTAQAIDPGFSIRRLSPALGAEVVGLDASKPFDPHTMQVVRDAFQEHHLLCFRDQRIEDDEMVAFSKQFGPLEEFPEKDKTKDKVEVYHVANVSREGEHLPEADERVVYQRNNARWHTDSSYRFIPRWPRSCTAWRCCRRMRKAGRPGSPTCSPRTRRFRTR